MEDKTVTPTGESLLPQQESQTEDADNDAEHLEKMADYKSYAKVFIYQFFSTIILHQGLMDIALLSANANQLRNAFDICEPFRTPMVVMILLSILLQVCLN